MMNRLIFYALIFFALGMAACTGGGSETAVAQTDETVTPTPYPEMPVPDSCPITQRPEPRFVPPEPYPEWAPGGDFWYGTNELWIDLRFKGTWLGLPKSDAGYVNKIALWSESYSQTMEQQPEIALSARQLDGDAVVESYVRGNNAHHPDYGHFMMTGIELPTLGCWEITAEYLDVSLSFIVWVAP
jgi:hypothetical protein